MRFSVWAPKATTVDLVSAGKRFPLERGENGMFEADVAGLGPGHDYAFSVDRGDPRPDPRSRFQPYGVHGPSRVPDPHFTWTDRRFQPPPLAGGLIYELHVGTFSAEGTFDGAIARLDHLVDFGVTHVELMPVAEFPGARGWGYDGVDLYAPHHAYGGPTGLKRFVDACHARGLAVLLDVVYNHLGPNGNYLSVYGSYFTDRYRTPWGDALNLDGPGSLEVRRFLIENALYWLEEYHIDGLRLDAVHAIVDTSAIHFLEELTHEVRALEAHLERRLVVTAESDLNDARLVRPPEMGGYGLDAMWSDDVHHALHAVLTGERTGYYEDFGTLAALEKALGRGLVYDGVYSRHRQRRHGRRAPDLHGSQLVAFLQNHDQVGNRARGERIGHLVPLDRVRVGAALLLTAPFVPLIFQGEEWAASAPFPYFTDHDDAALGRAVSEGRKREFAAFGWRPEEIPDPQAPETFARAKLDFRELERSPHAETFEWYRRLVRLRRERPELTDDRLERISVRSDEEARTLIVERGRVRVVCNLGEAPAVIPASTLEGRELLLASKEPPRSSGEDAVLEPWSVSILG